VKRSLFGLTVALVVLLTPAGVATAEFGIAPGGVSFDVLDGAGEADLRAGAHPDHLRIDLELITNEAGNADQNMRDLLVELPPGIVGDPTAVAACPREVFDGGFFNEMDQCPPDTRVGTATVVFNGQDESSHLPIFNVAAAPDQMALFGSKFLWKLPMEMRMRGSDLGLTIGQTDLVQGASFTRMEIELWGIPVDHQEEVSAERRALLTMPTRCAEPLQVQLRLRSWQEPDVWRSAQADTGAPLAGCDALKFEPSVSFALDGPIADGPSGAEIEIELPQSDDPDGRASAGIEEATITLPEGMSISPGGVAGLTACSDEQFGLGFEKKASCPRSSRVGSVELASPVASKPLAGSIFIGREAPGERFRLFIVAAGPGVEAKFAGAMRADPRTGRLTAELGNLPDMPLSRLELRFDGGSRALLSTPPECGPATATAIFDPNNAGPAVRSSASAEIGRNPLGPKCASSEFAPEFLAGGSTRHPGHSTAFSVTLRRRDGEQSTDRFAIDFPLGMSAALKSVQACASAAASAGACPPSSRLGPAVIEAGAGPNPAVLNGGAYLTESHRDAPFGLALVFHAAIGPFDLGSLVVQAALNVDPRTGQVSVETDSLPRLVEGVPVRFQAIAMDLERPGFLLNPTSCEPQAVTATSRSTKGLLAKASTPFQLKGCERLRFRPAVSMRLTDRAELHRRGKPGLRIEVGTPKGSTNLRHLGMALPPLLQFEVSGLREICARAAAVAGRCPAGSRVGSAAARSPLLASRLRGSLYVVQPKGDGPPDLWASMESEGVEVDLASETSLRNGRMVSRFDDLPDLPLSWLGIEFDSGKRGVISLKRGLCAGSHPNRPVSRVTLEGHDEAYRLARVPLRMKHECGKPADG
jgi:hypothetical protein